MTIKDYNQVNWSEHFYLDETSPSGLRWSRTVFCGRNNSYVRFITGSPVGSIMLKTDKTPKAWRTEINGVTYYIHRIIWCLLRGYVDNTMVVDHINGNSIDNSLANLRLVPGQINNQNKAIGINNTTGVIGVAQSLNKGILTYSATWKGVNGEARSRAFSTRKYGSEEAFRLACEYRTAQIALLNENGANYTLRHGSA